MMNFHPEIPETALLLVDMQEKLFSAIPSASNALSRQQLMLAAAKELGLSVIVTEQYPKGLGPSVQPLKEFFQPDWPILEKSSFSCFGCDPFRIELKKTVRRSLAIMGVETHVCIQQTALDAAAQGYEVFLLSDAVSSRHEFDHKSALDLMSRQPLIAVTTVESFIFALLRDSAHPSFRTISKFLR
ncbi:MAG: hypothetical protein A2X49_03625 [Lentisphaerae bacterium GWF2_52_8]|nr:MAG: hypothetical protein A2X49_03625 [Lentisphaerae bacterium GWF2_52_8]